MTTIECVRCGRTGNQMAFRPFQNEVGGRLFEQICSDCWAEWLQHQQALINHHALNVQDPEAKKFLLTNMEQYLFEKQDGLPQA